ncbi:hypothetical protein PPSIR1_18402 [Plesiocystis pacifica SIR-1]|uniref:Uncharacterized protein n=1 Tax=Plesiocystis pacifica SIR-1 TaxID=391625 RepID=A6GKN2_9BACT|nr:hypothetical protein PPSIR1_18402 [Plesiocystis pacifica SIR-1]
MPPEQPSMCVQVLFWQRDDRFPSPAHTHVVKLPSAIPYLTAAALSIACTPSSSNANDDADAETGSEDATTETETETGTETETETGTGDTDENSCASPEECGPDEWCDFPDDLCGAGQLGECLPRPDECDGLDVEICGCDGNAHIAGCEAAEGVDRSNDTSMCETPEGAHVCGELFCPSDSYYCQQAMLDGENPGPDVFSCRELPEACSGSEDCACLAEETCGSFCEFADGHFTLICPGG